MRLRSVFSACVTICLVLASFVFFAGTTHADDHAQTPELSVRLISKTEDYKAGTPVTLGLSFDIQPGWHIYTNPPGDAGLPTDVKWQSQSDINFSSLQYPPHQTFDEQGLTTYGYANSVLLTATATPKAKDTLLPITANVSWLACKSICIPGNATLDISLPIAQGDNARLSMDAVFFPTADVQQAPETISLNTTLTLSLALGFAVLGGLILNLMPCVFPILALKVFHLAKLSTEERSQVRIQSLVYVAGVLTGFAIIGGALVALTASGNALGWGYQLQSPAIVLSLALLMLWVGLHMAEVTPQGDLFAKLTSRIPATSSPFMTGLLAVAVASPCTAPFMGGALGYAALQTPEIGFLVIMGVGFGFALPFTLIAWLPSLTRFLPKPGPWMLSLKKWLSIPMFGAATWLIWVLSQQVAPEGLYTLAALLALIGISCSIKLKRHNMALIAIATVSTIWFVEQTPRQDHKATHYPAYSPQALSILQSEGSPVLVDFTAAWCITCAVNERSTLYTDEAEAFFKAKGIERLTADWTQRNPMISKALQDMGRNGVPVYALYLPGHAQPFFLPEVLTPSLLKDEIEKYLEKESAAGL